MLLAAVRAGHFARNKPVVYVPPVIRTGVRCVDADFLRGIDRLQHPLDLWPLKARRKRCCTDRLSSQADSRHWTLWPVRQRWASSGPPRTLSGPFNGKHSVDTERCLPSPTHVTTVSARCSRPKSSLKRPWRSRKRSPGKMSHRVKNLSNIVEACFAHHPSHQDEGGAYGNLPGRTRARRYVIGGSWTNCSGRSRPTGQHGGVTGLQDPPKELLLRRATTCLCNRRQSAPSCRPGCLASPIIVVLEAGDDVDAAMGDDAVLGLPLGEAVGTCLGFRRRWQPRRAPQVPSQPAPRRPQSCSSRI